MPKVIELGTTAVRTSHLAESRANFPKDVAAQRMLRSQDGMLTPWRMGVFARWPQRPNSYGICRPGHDFRIATSTGISRTNPE
jgi:hypothetical protein